MYLLVILNFMPKKTNYLVVIYATNIKPLKEGRKVQTKFFSAIIAKNILTDR